MNEVLEQLGLDNTFFIEFAIFFVLFLLLSNLYFKPFLKLFQARHKKTVEDRETAEKLVLEAQAKLNEYKKILQDERMATRAEYEKALNAVKKHETEQMTQARDEARKITQQTLESIEKQRENLKKQLSADVETLAQSISERLLSRKV